MTSRVDFHNPKTFNCVMQETRVELQDNPLDPLGLIEPVQLSYLNVESCIEKDLQASDFTIVVNLSNRVQIQKRVVYNILMMFGDVGGLYDFLGLFLATIFGFISQNLMLARMVEKLFHFTT